MRNLDLFRGNDFFPNVRTWRPLLQEIDQLFNTVATPNHLQNAGNSLAHHDVDETSDHYILSFDVPGIAKENLDIQIIGNQISIKGERKNSYKEANGIKEAKRTFERTVTLPTDLKADAVEAHYENGVLSLFVPKAEEAKPRKVQISESKDASTH